MSHVRAAVRANRLRWREVARAGSGHDRGPLGRFSRLPVRGCREGRGLERALYELPESPNTAYRPDESGDLSGLEPHRDVRQPEEAIRLVHAVDVTKTVEGFSPQPAVDTGSWKLGASRRKPRRYGLA
jgi:hypothetical protein